MKALTLTQPWATLVAVGAKRIETRSWSTRYRGPLAIHAAASVRPWRELDAPHLMSERGPIQAVFKALGVLSEDGKSWPSPLDYGDGSTIVLGDVHLPLGTVVATCRLVDVVPITGSGHGSPAADSRVAEFPHDGPLPHQEGGLWVVGPTEWTHGFPTRIESELPFGDFTPGRFAWLLADVEPLPNSVPVKGKQRLWEWEPEEVIAETNST